MLKLRLNYSWILLLFATNSLAIQVGTNRRRSARGM